MLLAVVVLSGGCTSGKDSGSSREEKGALTHSNTRSFDEWTVSPGHPWHRMSEERKVKKEQKRLEKEMAKDEEAFRKEFPATWNQ
jgi:hypothetical protein